MRHCMSGFRATPESRVLCGGDEERTAVVAVTCMKEEKWGYDSDG
jgi:hypothetical protein